VEQDSSWQKAYSYRWDVDPNRSPAVFTVGVGMGFAEHGLTYRFRFRLPYFIYDITNLLLWNLFTLALTFYICWLIVDEQRNALDSTTEYNSYTRCQPCKRNRPVLMRLAIRMHIDWNGSQSSRSTIMGRREGRISFIVLLWTMCWTYMLKLANPRQNQSTGLTPARSCLLEDKFNVKKLRGCLYWKTM
jgi:hypothetical protein